MDAPAEQIAYYRARASAYDWEAYESKGEDWHAEMSLVVAAFQRVELVGDVVELAAGTGVWTERLARRGAAVTALDASPEMLAINSARLAAAGCTATYEVVDLLAWRPARTWDALVACFWLTHVPEDALSAMLHAMANAVRAGGALFVADKAEGRGRRARELEDGRRFSVIDEARGGERLAAALDTAGFDVEAENLGRRFCVVHGVRR